MQKKVLIEILKQLEGIKKALHKLLENLDMEKDIKKSTLKITRYCNADIKMY